MYQGDTLAISVWLPADLAGASARLQVRAWDGAALTTLDIGTGLTLIPGELPPATPEQPVPVPPSSRIDINPDAAQRTAVAGQTANYDLQTTQAGSITTWLRGRFVVTPEIAV